jgi:hypothetical protein
VKHVLRLGLKYCGGCNPSFDRVALVRTLAARLIGLVRLVPFDDPSAGHVLIVAGCRSACVDLAPFDGRWVHLLCDAADLERLIGEFTFIAKGRNP